MIAEVLRFLGEESEELSSEPVQNLVPAMPLRCKEVFAAG
jgi:hypothetical protein